MLSKLSLLPICLKCRSQCCRSGSPIIFPKEREKIIKFCSRDYFEKKSNYYIIPKNPCPYLTKNNLCSIEEVKPLDCTVYPVGPIHKNDKITVGVSQKCPAKFMLPEHFIPLAKKYLNSLTKEQKEELVKLNETYRSKFDFKEHNKSFGLELVLDMYGCDVSLFTKANINKFFIGICKKINMERQGKPVFWHDNSKTPHLKGTSAMQFITTSNSVVHALEILGVVYINIFSCKMFDTKKATKFSKGFFKAEEVVKKIIERK